jgi:hypothetical protein
MSEDKKTKIDWSDVVTKSVSALVTIMIASAVAVVWKGATSVDEKINANSAIIMNQQKTIEQTMKVMGSELADIRKELKAAKTKADAHLSQDPAAAGSDRPIEGEEAPAADEEPPSDWPVPSPTEWPASPPVDSSNSGSEDNLPKTDSNYFEQKVNQGVVNAPAS